MTPRKRKATAKALGEDLAETSPAPKRAKASAKAPKEPAAKALNGSSAKNNSKTKSAKASARPSRKRKANISDDDSAEASPTPQRPKAPSETPKIRAIAPRAAKVDRNDPFWLTTNEKSPLATEDLYAELSNPKTYEHLTKEDWDDLREALPPNVPLSSDGYSIPIDFFKYDADFRRGIREFQEDLSTGRLDPGWQEAAGEAMEERARGDFDSYKENQFEEFWGQKQKLDSKAVAGESAKLKLDVMIQNGVFKEGDFFSYSRVAGRAKARVMVEKECKIVTVGSNTLKFAIPPGQLKYARPMAESRLAIKDSPEQEQASQSDDVTQLAAPNNLSEEAPNVANGDPFYLTNGIEPPAESQSDDAETTKDNAEAIKDNAEASKDNAEATADNAEMIKDNAQDTNDNDEVTKENAEATEDNVMGTKIKANGGETKGEDIGAMVVESVEQHENRDPCGALPVANVEDDEVESVSKTEVNRTTAELEGIDHNSSTTATASASNFDDAVLHEISTLSQLEVKILEIDGRLNLNEVRPSINPWKALRGKRNNQDLGTLFEMREEFYVWKHPHIPKPPRSGPYGLR